MATEIEQHMPTCLLTWTKRPQLTN